MGKVGRPRRETPKFDAKARLIEVAARHFAERGFEGASQRAIQREVGVNPATAHYYYGSKEALYRAVIDTYLGAIQAERLAALPHANETAGARARLYALLSAYLSPHIEAASTEQGYYYARILAGIQFNAEGPAVDIITETITPVREQYRRSLYPLFPSATPERVDKALQMAVMVMAFSPPIQSRQALLSADTRRALVADVVDFAAAGFEALLGPPVI